MTISNWSSLSSLLVPCPTALSLQRTSFLADSVSASARICMVTPLRRLPSKQTYRLLLGLGVFVSIAFVLSRIFFGAENLLATGTLHDPPEVHGLRAAHGFTPYPAATAEARREIYDLTMINAELDWLEIRLDSLYDGVDSSSS